MYERLNRNAKGAVAYRITQPLIKAEVYQITSELEGMISAEGKIRVLIDLQAFPYADLGGVWEDLKFDVKHMKDIKRLALVGGSVIEKWSTRIFATFTLTTCRCFQEEEVDEAWSWLIKD